MSEATRGANAAVAWRDVTRMRDKIVYHYFRLKLEAIWQTVTEDVPALKSQIAKIIEKSVEK